jgi:hypothetical protein
MQTTTTQTALPESLTSMIAEYASWGAFGDRYIVRMAEIVDSPHYRAMFRCTAMGRGLDVSAIVAADDLKDRS